jgi:hypothetical protein
VNWQKYPTFELPFQTRNRGTLDIIKDPDPKVVLFNIPDLFLSWLDIPLGYIYQTDDTNA